MGNRPAATPIALLMDFVLRTCHVWRCVYDKQRARVERHAKAARRQFDHLGTLPIRVSTISS